MFKHSPGISPGDANIDSDNIDNMGYIPYDKEKYSGDIMPTICHFKGIIIVMYLRNKEHNPPHVHAITQDFDAPFLIQSGEMMEGYFPLKAKELVRALSCIIGRN